MDERDPLLASNKTIAAIKINAATLPTTIPAMAPPDNPLGAIQTIIKIKKKVRIKSDFSVREEKNSTNTYQAIKIVCILNFES